MANELAPQQNKFMDNWLSPESKTFGNAYQSALDAGYSDSYARNITHLAPQWLSEYVDRNELTPQHINSALKKLIIQPTESKDPDSTRLKAIELLSRLKGLMVQRHEVRQHTVNVNVDLTKNVEPQTVVLEQVNPNKEE